MPDYVVTETPRRHDKTLLATDRLSLALDFVEAHVGRPSTRLVVWFPDAPATVGPDVTVAVPLRVYQEIEVVADQIVEAWDTAWLLIDSMRTSQRDGARGDLVGAIAAALISAAVTGLDGGEGHTGI